MVKRKNLRREMDMGNVRMEVATINKRQASLKQMAHNRNPEE